MQHWPLGAQILLDPKLRAEKLQVGRDAAKVLVKSSRCRPRRSGNLECKFSGMCDLRSTLHAVGDFACIKATLRMVEAASSPKAAGAPSAPQPPSKPAAAAAEKPIPPCPDYSTYSTADLEKQIA